MRYINFKIFMIFALVISVVFVGYILNDNHRRNLSKQVRVKSVSYKTIDDKAIKTNNDYSNIDYFWRDFRNVILNNDSNKLIGHVRFPLKTKGSLDSDPIIEFGESKFKSVFNIFLNQLSGENIENFDETEFDYIKRMEKLYFPEDRIGPTKTEEWAHIDNMKFRIVDDSWKLDLIYLDDDSYEKLGIKVHGRQE